MDVIFSESKDCVLREQLTNFVLLERLQTHIYQANQRSFWFVFKGSPNSSLSL